MPSDRERAMETARELASEAHCRYCPGEDNDPRLKCARDILSNTDDMADALLEAEAQGVSGAGTWLFAQSTGFPVNDPRRQAYEWAAAQFDLHAAELRAQKVKP